MCLGLPDRLLGLVVVHDDVGAIGRADGSEVELLGGDVTLAPAPFDFDRTGHPALSDHGTIHGLLECGRHEDAQVPGAFAPHWLADALIETGRILAIAVIAGITRTVRHD